MSKISQKSGRKLVMLENTGRKGIARIFFATPWEISTPPPLEAILKPPLFNSVLHTAHSSC